MELADLRNFDYLLFIIIALSTYLAWRKGFIESFVDFFAWVGSAFIVADNYNAMAEFLSGFISSKFVCGFIASFCFYIALVILFYIIGNKILKAAAKFCGSTPDKIVGIFFGLLRGAIVAMIIFWSCYMILTAWNDDKPEWFAKAQSYRILNISSTTMVDLITSEEDRQKLLKMIQRKSDNLEDEVKKNTATKSKAIKQSVDDHSEDNFLNNDENDDGDDF